MFKNGITQEQLNSLNYNDLAIKQMKTEKQLYAIEMKEVEKMKINAEKVRQRVLNRLKKRKEVFVNDYRKRIPMSELTSEIIDKNIAFGFEFYNN